MEPDLSTKAAIAVHAQDDQVCHAAMPAHDFGNTPRLQGFVNTAEQRRTTDLHMDAPSANGPKES
jgi:hypothetical protein